MLDKLIEDLKKEMQLDENFSTSTPGVWEIPFEGDMRVKISDLKPDVFFHSVIGPIPLKEQERFFIYTLQGNLFGQGTLGSILGLSDDGVYLTLSRHVNYDISYQEFRDHLEDFINGVVFWQEELSTFAEK